MSTTDLLCIVLLAAALFLWLQSHLRLRMNDLLRKQLKSEREHRPVAPAGEWRVLPGPQLELAATGFYIRMRPDPNQGDFILYSPEGHIVAHGNELPLLKTCGERLAAYRSEFHASTPKLPANLKR